MKKDPVYRAYYLANFLWKHHVPYLPWLIRGFMRVIFACDISYETKIGVNTLFPHHALGVVIHKDAIIGENCVLEQNVTIGGRSGLTVLPIIGNNVEIGAGASVLGPVKIGNNVKIGAGAVVIKDVPDNCTAVGVPAHVIQREG